MTDLDDKPESPCRKARKAQVDAWIREHSGRMIVKAPRRDVLDCGTHVYVDMGESEEAMMAILRAYALQEEGMAVVYGDRHGEDGED